MRRLLAIALTCIAMSACAGSCRRPSPPPQPQPAPGPVEPIDDVPPNARPVPVPPLARRSERVLPGQMLDLRVHVALRDERELDKFLADAHNPASPGFNKSMSQEEFRRRFFPSEKQMQRVRLALQKQGMVVEPRARGAVLHARSSVGNAEHAFGTELRRTVGPHGRDIRAIASPMEIPPELRIESVQGMASAPVRRTHYVRRPKARVPAYTGPLSAALTRQAYNIPPKALGAGQTVGVIALDGYKADDVATYAAVNGLSQPRLHNVYVDGYDGKILGSDTQTEVTMDIELIAAIAPEAAEIRVFSAAQTDTAFFDLWNEIANPTTPDKKLVKVINCSWGAPEAALTRLDVQSEATLFKQMAAQGQTVFVASGDNGAKDDGYNVGVDDPASQPYAIGVGGTHVSAPGGVWTNETTWTDGGGGISSFWPIPVWQVGVGSPPALLSRQFRNVPDVALNADPASGYAVFVAGNWQTVGGTSCAAPIWSGFMALVHEARAARKLPPLGFFAPVLYALAATAGGQAGFHDIADGSSNGYYPAVAGYDLATGWGSLNGTPLLEALAPARPL